MTRSSLPDPLDEEVRRKHAELDRKHAEEEARKNRWAEYSRVIDAGDFPRFLRSRKRQIVPLFPPLPQCLEPEQSALGAMLIESTSCTYGLLNLGPAEFYREGHRAIFKAIGDLYESEEPVDLVTVAEELRRAGILAEVGGSDYLGALIEACPSSANIAAYCNALIRVSRLRYLFSLSERLRSDSLESAANPEELIRALKSALE